MHGLMPLPCLPGEKHPYVSWTDYRETPPSPEETLAWFPHERIGAWGPTGPVNGWAVLDTDNDEGEKLWRERLGDALLDSTTCVRTRKGYHYWFRIPKDQPFPRWTHENDPEAIKRKAKFDVLGKGYGAMLPPSYFPDGIADDSRERYEWIRGPEHAQPAPAGLRRPSKSPGGHSLAAARAQAGGTLATRLNNPPDEGSRNNWHAEVAGYLAKIIPHEDGFLALAAYVNNGLANPLDDGEVETTWKSIWQAEQSKGGKGKEASGWLSSDGHTLFQMVSAPEGDKHIQRPVPWLNGDVRITGVINGKDHSRSYVVVVHPHNRQPVSDVVRANVLGSAQETKRWLAKHGLSTTPPPLGVRDLANGFDPGGRLIRFFEDQQPEEHQSVGYLGWQDSVGFVCHEGIITADGMRPFNGIIPEPELRERAPYVYGMGPEEEAKEILAEILTYQEPWVAAVFGSWWVMCFLKGQVMGQTGHFPYMIVEAASEAGKTRGMFSLLRVLSGSTQHGTGTKASIRDSMGVHRSGIVHVDDAQSVDHLEELLREAPGEGYWSKKDQDNRTNINIKLVAPVMLSGEAINLRDEKAHRDRSVLIEGVPSPKSRMSLKDPTKPQIDDVMEMMSRDLSEFSGTIVMLALRQAEIVNQIKGLRGAAGRHNEVMAIVRAGARVLDAILDREWAAPLVDLWASTQEDLGAENTLVTKVLPWALLEYKGDLWGKIHPMYYGFVDGPEGMWMHVPTVAMLWQKELGQRRKSDRLDSPEAFIAQLKAMKSEFKQKSIGGKKPKCWKIPDEYRKAVYAYAGLEIDDAASARLARYQAAHSANG